MDTHEHEHGIDIDSTPFTRPMNDDEDDAFDPTNTNTNTNSHEDQDQQIRDARSKRALQRRTDGGDLNFDDHHASITASTCSGTTRNSESKSKSDRGKYSAGRRDGDAGMYDGEEEVDEQYSLLHEQQQQQHHPDTTTSITRNTSITTESEEQKEHDPQLQSKSENGFGKSEKEQCPIEPFNMTAEREDGEGYFDGDTYIFRRGNGGDEEEDAWLDGLKQDGDGDAGSGSRSASGAGSKHSESASAIESMMRNTQSQSQSQSQTNHQDTLTKEQIYDQFIPLLATDSETVMQALGRYGTIIKREKKRNQTTARTRVTGTGATTKGAGTGTGAKKKHESASTKALDRLTELSSLSMMKFDDTNVYEHNRQFFSEYLRKSDGEEGIKRKRSYFGGEQGQGQGRGGGDNQKRSRGEDDAVTSAATATVTATATATASKMWEYRGNQDHSIHGPYTTSQMLDWIKAGYFIGATAVDVRSIVRSNAIATASASILLAKTAGGDKQEVVNDLLGDLEDSDDDEEGGEGGGHGDGERTNADGTNASSSAEWQKSDEVDFSSFL
jgi:hypothetical protein